ncbi:unnamed protein product [Trichogramma brassicae]|uniref:Uncharacterized protein n=1 Tax=Trichogramma brassicae TaxID=86971 RepID=A0A6H5J8E3_9HYME|nr:unnamed protein product [Trichogramma brassicae]
MALDNHDCFKQLKSLRDKVNWKVEAERHYFFYQVEPLFNGWVGQLPILKNIVGTEEMSWLLMNYYQKEEFVKFVASSGYKEEPKPDEKGAKPSSSRRTTLVHRAAKIRSYSCLAMTSLFEIVDRFDVNYVDDSGRTHFHLACERGLFEVCRKFIDRGLDVNCIEPKTGASGLHLAVEHNRGRVAELLLRLGKADPNSVNAEGRTPLHIICMKDDKYNHVFADLFFKVVKHMEKKVAVDARDKMGWTPLQYVLQDVGCKKELLRVLLSNGADPNLIVRLGMTPLHLICNRDSDDGLAEVFFKVTDDTEQEVKVDTKDVSGRTPLQYAVANLLPNVVGLLLKHRADLASFVFPSEDYFAAMLEWRPQTLIWGFFKLRLAAGALGCLEHLEKAGYQPSKSDVSQIIKLFSKYQLYEMAKDESKKLMLDIGSWADKAKKEIVTENLSLYDLVQCRVEDVADAIEYADYFSFPNRVGYWPSDVCAQRLCETAARGFFRRWIGRLAGHQEAFAECPGGILDGLTNRELCDIFLRAEEKSSQLACSSS